MSTYDIFTSCAPIAAVLAWALMGEAPGDVSSGHIVELREPGCPPRRFAIVAELVVGRDCEGLIVADAQVSRRHLVLEVSQAGLTVMDLGSTNGTLVNDVPINAPVTVGAGDRIRLGDVEIAVVGPP